VPLPVVRWESREAEAGGLAAGALTTSSIVSRNLEGSIGLAEEEPLFQPVRPIKDGKVIRGRDGWLFLARDSNDVLGQHTGATRLSADQIGQWQRLLKARSELLADLGASYLFMVAPNTHAIYEDKLPDSMPHALRRPVHQLRDGLAEVGLDIPFLYPLAELKAARADRDVCCQTDSHWNEYGAFAAYQRAVDMIEGAAPVRRLREHDVVFFDQDAIATDLGYKLDSEQHARWTVAWLRHGGARLVRDNRIEGRGGLVMTECGYATGTCVLVGDSYSWALLKFLAESFRRFVFVQSSTLDFELLDQVRPDVVINLMAERFLVFPPDDVGAPTVREEEQRKLKQGRVRPRIPFWDLNPRPSIHEVERLIARLRADARERDAAIVSVLAYAGLKPEEVVELRWGDLRDDQLEVWPARQRPGPIRRFARGLRQRLGIPKRPARVIPLPPTLRHDLERWQGLSVDVTPAAGRLFPALDGGAWKEGDWREWRDELAAQYQLGDWRAYSLRHCFCVLLINAGTPVHEVARQLGTTVDAIRNQYAPLIAHAGEDRPVSVEAQVRWARGELDLVSERGQSEAERIVAGGLNL
jgi:alginate O-acetyltransferase complex protein AlgJ